MQDLAICLHGANVTSDQYLYTEDFIAEIVLRLEMKKSRL